MPGITTEEELTDTEDEDDAEEDQLDNGIGSVLLARSKSSFVNNPVRMGSGVSNFFLEACVVAAAATLSSLSTTAGTSLLSLVSLCSLDLGEELLGGTLVAFASVVDF